VAYFKESPFFKIPQGIFCIALIARLCSLLDMEPDKKTGPRYRQRRSGHQQKCGTRSTPAVDDHHQPAEKAIEIFCNRSQSSGIRMVFHATDFFSTACLISRWVRVSVPLPF
jgi:hypothetical protein